jgi:hypothetical protein
MNDNDMEWIDYLLEWEGDDDTDYWRHHEEISVEWEKELAWSLRQHRLDTCGGSYGLYRGMLDE